MCSKHVLYALSHKRGQRGDGGKEGRCRVKERGETEESRQMEETGETHHPIAIQTFAKLITGQKSFLTLICLDECAEGMLHVDQPRGRFGISGALVHVLVNHGQQLPRRASARIPGLTRRCEWALFIYWIDRQDRRRHCCEEIFK